MEWTRLSPLEKAIHACRIVLVGAESSGKTTLSQELAEHYRSRGGIWAETNWVPEYGRRYTEILLERQGRLESEPDVEVHSAEWGPDDFALIALVQKEREDEAAASGSPVLICDTDAFATQIWERRYLGEDSTAAYDAQPHQAERGLYLLTEVREVPFEQDGIRDGEQFREAMQQWFVDELNARQLPWALVTGTPAERLATSIRLVDDVLKRRFPTGV